MHGSLRGPTLALAEAWREKRMPRGASTITQQLARNLDLSPERTLTRKAREFRWRTGLIYRRAFGQAPEPDTATAPPHSARPSPADGVTLPAADSVNFSGIPLDTVPYRGGS